MVFVGVGGVTCVDLAGLSQTRPVLSKNGTHGGSVLCGHSPELLRLVGQDNVQPSSTNPTPPGAGGTGRSGSRRRFGPDQEQRGRPPMMWWIAAADRSVLATNPATGFSAIRSA